MRVPGVLRLLAGGAFMLMVAVLFVGGAQPQAAGLFDDGWDKLAHFGYFAMLAACAMVATDLRHPALVVISVSVVGIADELAQTQLPGRHADIPDLATDIGATIVTVVALLAAGRYFARARRS
jgi:VanZ family protein